MLKRASLLGLVAICSCLGAPVDDDTTGAAPNGIESYSDLSSCGRARLTCEIAGCTSVEVACNTSHGEGRDTVQADGVDIVCQAAIEAGCGNRHLTETLERCEAMCAASPADSDG